MACINCGDGGRLKSGGSCVPCYGASNATWMHDQLTGHDIYDREDSPVKKVDFDVDCSSCHSEGKHDHIVSKIKEGTIHRGNVQSAWITHKEPEKMNNQAGARGTSCADCRQLAGDWYN